jgi:LEA14-like dessication related protein
MVDARQGLKYAGIALVVLVVLLVLAYLLGIIGVPSVTGVENAFGPVNSTDTVVETELGVHNPNPLGITLGGTTVNYTVFMNEVTMAHGRKAGLSLGSGDGTLNFTTYLQNERIPDWWYTHVKRGEVTEVLIDADLSVGLLFGATFDFESNQTIRTDILSGFNTSETRPIDAGAPLVSDPVLYLNSTSGWYGDDLTRERTPIETGFTVYNPKPWPYTITEIGYEIRMNDVTVGTGATDQPYTITPKSNETLRATTAIRNDRLDEWWVSHLQRNQVTNLTVDFYVMVQPEIVGQSADPIRLDVDQFDYSTVIETDMFGNKPANGSTGDGAGTGEDGDGSADGDGPANGDDSPDEDGGSTATTTADTTTTTDDGGILGGGDDTTTTATAVPTATPTPTPTTTTRTPTSTQTPTTTTTEDDGLLSVLLPYVMEM